MNSNYTNTNPSRKRGGKNLVLARSGLFYGIQYFPVKEEKNSINRGITSTPNFLFHTNNTKVLIDFSDFKNEDTKKELEDYWSLLVSGMSFTIINGKLYNQTTASNYDISGTYVFRKIENLVIHADVTSVTSITTKINLYQKTEFLETPGFEFPTIIEKKKKDKRTKIINKLGSNTKNSFTFFGTEVDDYIQLQNFNIRYRVLDISIDSEGKEVLTIDGEIPEEDRTSTKTFVGLFVEKKNKKEITIDPNITSVGSCTFTSGGAVLSCTDNQTLAQCECRSLDDQQVIFTEGGTCPAAEEDPTPPNSTQLLTEIASTLVSIIDRKQTSFNTIGSFNSFANPMTNASTNR